ncbi:MAG: universal stress protein, partial [Acidobacteriota bacterium]|nr:universal stress protein [Acidobacteriota bacterium]
MITFNNILFPVDFSKRSHAAAPFVLSLAQRYGAKVVLLHAFGPPPPIYGGMYTKYPGTYDFTGLQAELQPKLVEFAEAELPKVDTSCVVELGSPEVVIAEYAEINRMDLIAMPTHGYGPFRRALLGSVTAKVLHDAKIPVWTDAHAPEPSHRAHPKPRHILAALDLKPETLRTLEVALQLGRDAGATVEIVHAAPEGEIAPKHSETRLQQVLAEAAREQLVKVQQQAGAEVDLVVDGGSVATLVRSVALRRRSDLIV